MRFLPIASLIACLTSLNIYAEHKSHGDEAWQLPKLVLKPAFEKHSFSQLIEINQFPNEPNAWLMVEKRGKIWNVIDDKKKLVLDLSRRVDTRSEAGLLSLSFHPNFKNNALAVIYYNYQNKILRGKPLMSRIAAVKWDNKKQVFDASSETIILEVEQPFGNHDGGLVEFGPDGYLYIGLGDGGSAGDPHNHGQNTQTLLGALLRLAIDNNGQKIIPEDNPFINNARVSSEIYAYGLRNPWQFSFDRKTQDLWLADVGQYKYEEVNIVTPGGNYGWPCMEGFHVYDQNRCPKDKSQYQAPIIEYGRDHGSSITGGVVYRGSKIPALEGVYIYGDFVSGKVWLHKQGKRNTHSTKQLSDTGMQVTSFYQDHQGEVYIVDFDGDIVRIDI